MLIKWLTILALLAALPLMAATATPIQNPHITFVNASGVACAGCSLYTYAAGTTTPQATYTDANEGAQNTNPIILDASGAANIWVGSNAYKFVLKDTTGTTLWTVDLVGSSSLYCATGGCTMSGQLSAPYGFSFDSTVDVSGNSYGITLDKTGATDICANFTNLVASVPTGTTLFFPQGTYLVAQTCNAGAGLELTKSVNIVGEGSGYYDGTTIHNATVIKGTIQLATFPGTVAHLAIDCRGWTIACDGAASGTGGMNVDDLLYVGQLPTYQAHAVLVQADTNHALPSNINNIRAYAAQHAVAVRAAHTNVSNVWAYESFDVITKANVTEGDAYDVNWNNINLYSSGTAGAEFIVEGDTGATAYNVTGSNINFYNAPYGVYLNAPGGGIRQVALSNINSYNSGTTVISFVSGAGSIGATTINGLNVWNATNANVINNAGNAALSLSNVTINGTLTNPATVYTPAYNGSPNTSPVIQAWDWNSTDADMITANSSALAGWWFRTPSGANFYHGRFVYSSSSCGGQPGWVFDTNITAQARSFPSTTQVACLDQNGVFYSGRHVISKLTGSEGLRIVPQSDADGGNISAGTTNVAGSVWNWSILQNGSYQIGGNTILPTQLTGYHGTAGTKAQLSDGTGASGNIASYAADGSLTDSGLAVSTALASRTCNANGCYQKYADGTIHAWGSSTAVTGTPTAQALTITFPTTFTTTTNLHINATSISDAPGDANPHPSSCHITRSTITTGGATAVISVDVQVGGSGYTTLATGDYCSWEADGN